MASEKPKQVKIFDITLRDGSQSKVATRIQLDDLLKVKNLQTLGIYGAETRAGATFDVCVRYLREKPWERARVPQASMPNVKEHDAHPGTERSCRSIFPTMWLTISCTPLPVTALTYSGSSTPWLIPEPPSSDKGRQRCRQDGRGSGLATP